MSLIKLWGHEIEEELDRQKTQHTIRFPFAECVFWRNNRAADYGEKWDKVRITVPGQQYPAHEIFVEEYFELSEPYYGARSDMIDVLRLLHAAFEAGGVERSTQFRLLIDAAQR